MLRKVSPSDALRIADPIMNALLMMFDTSARENISGTQEDALMAVGTLVEGNIILQSLFKEHVISV